MSRPIPSAKKPGYAFPMKKFLAALVLLSASAWAEPAPAYLAGYDPVRQDEPGALLAGKLAEKYGFPETDVDVLRAKGMRWREVEFSLAIARRAGASPESVAESWEAGVPWEEIARRRGFALDEAVPIPAAAH